jgi:hypothetical protein
MELEAFKNMVASIEVIKMKKELLENFTLIG